ncbi:TPA: hypothetical protein ACH3X1_010277 [Trebouxia sp. C0004]
MADHLDDYPHLQHLFQENVANTPLQDQSQSMSASVSASGWDNGMHGNNQGEAQRLLSPQQLSYGSQITFPDQSALSLQGSQQTEQQRLEAAALYCQQLQQQPLTQVFNACLDNQSGQDLVRYESASDQAEWQQHRQSELERYQQQQLLQQQELDSSLDLTGNEPPAKKGPGRPSKGKQGQPRARKQPAKDAAAKSDTPKPSSRSWEDTETINLLECWYYRQHDFKTAGKNGAKHSSGDRMLQDSTCQTNLLSILERRREKALKDTKGTARWWKFFQVVTSRDLQTDEATAVHLLCTLCDTKLSATNESRIATNHLKHAGCSKVRSDTEIAAQAAAAFIKDAAPEQQDRDDKEVLAQLQHKKRKTSGQPSVAERLAGPVLDKKYAETVGSVDQVLNVNGVHALAVSTI